MVVTSAGTSRCISGSVAPSRCAWRIARRMIRAELGQPVEALWAEGYKPADFYQNDPDLRRAIDLIASGAFSDGDRTAFEPIVSNLLYDDRFMVLADYASYIAAQAKVDAAFADQDAWTRSAILNVARTGFFSSDRSIRDYIDRIWHTPPVL